MAAALLIVVVLPLLSMCSAAIHLRLKLSTQASILLHHMTHGTATPSVREALRSLSKEQQYSGELFAGFTGVEELSHPLLNEQDAAAQDHPHHHFQSVAADTQTEMQNGKTNPITGNSSSEWNGKFSSSPADLTRADTAPNSASPAVANGTGSSTGSSAASSSPGTSSSAPAATEEEEDTTANLWSRLTWHNTKLTLLQGFARVRLVELAYTPTVVVDSSALMSTTTSMAMYQS